MTEFYNFLNSQSGDRLAGYAAVLLIALYIIMLGICDIFKILKRK
jgi:hypothetical protein